ncbi:hypothetical protein CUC08_Gglean004415 [Alternaria sp. MG1]|nr:hypothetical protein CUC08_Gglean004415 [Alternaria sp. MG1]
MLVTSGNGWLSSLRAVQHSLKGPTEPCVRLGRDLPLAVQAFCSRNLPSPSNPQQPPPIPQRLLLSLPHRHLASSVEQCPTLPGYSDQSSQTSRLSPSPAQQEPRVV